MPTYRTQSGLLIEADLQTEMSLEGARSLKKQFLDTADEVEAAIRQRGEAKRPTFQAAKAAILAYLQQQGWKVNPHLKVPHATSPDGELRLWFKAQAVYYSWGDKHTLGDARSLHSDIRDMTPEAFVAEAERLGRSWGKSHAMDFQQRWGGME